MSDRASNERSSPFDFRDHTVFELAADVRARRRSARELTQHALDRVAALDPVYNAFVIVDADLALAAAAGIDERIAAGDRVGPLAGIPLGVKDLEDVAGYPTRYGSKLSSLDPVDEDSVVVSRLVAAGCVVIGKTTTPEYGHKGATESLLTGITRNPWNPDHTAGGSSGGSAAALAAGMVPLATGSDGGGSIRLPAAICGFSGIKTTQGRVPNGGPNPPGSAHFSVKGPMALRIADSALALDSCIGPHPSDPFSLPHPSSSWFGALGVNRLPSSVVWSPTMGFAEVDREIAGGCGRAIDQLSDLGVEIIEIDDLWPTDPLQPWWNLWAALRARTQGHLRGTAQWEDIDPSLRFQIEWGLDRVTAGDIVASLDAIHHYSLRLSRAFEQAPLLLTPTAAGQIPLVGQDGVVNGTPTRGWVKFSYGFNLTRNPAGTVNCGFTSAGMPVGLQVASRQLEDVLVIQALAAMEDVFEAGRVFPVV
ncbi:MAG: amidase family protein [Actinomycetota bacterium]|nr:amidase family protein [Actinomycetota bacterium]